MCEYFQKPKPLGGNVKVELNLSNYAKQEDSKMQQVLMHLILLKGLFS